MSSRSRAIIASSSKTRTVDRYFAFSISRASISLHAIAHRSVKTTKSQVDEKEIIFSGEGKAAIRRG
jgi:ketosteroid isomerase-like protein